MSGIVLGDRSMHSIGKKKNVMKIINKLSKNTLKIFSSLYLYYFSGWFAYVLKIVNTK